MNNTVKTERGKTRMIAHRGLSLVNIENTLPAFSYAGMRSHYGTECDVHVTVDGKYVIFHDDRTGRLCDKDVEIERSTLSELRALAFKDDPKGECVIPTLQEYLQVTKTGDKVAFIELKNAMSQDNVKEIIDICRAEYALDKIVFISFVFDNLLKVRAVVPEQPVMFLSGELDDGIVEKLCTHKIDSDVGHWSLTAETVEKLHGRGIAVNCWTCNDAARAAELVGFGVDYITTDILE